MTTDSGTILELLPAEVRSHVLRDEPLAGRTTLRVGGPADLYYRAENLDLLAQTLAIAQAHGISHSLIGEGSNLCVSDSGIRGLLIQNACRAAEIGPLTRSDTGHNLMRLFQATLWANLSGLEFAVGIPGTVGGALVSNAGAYRANICDLVNRVEVVEAGERKWVDPEWMEFSYRDSRLRRDGGRGGALIAVELRLTEAPREQILEKARDLQRQRISKQPWLPSAGSFFKNVLDRDLAASLPTLPAAMKEAGVVPAGYLTEQCGAKGFRIGNAAFSVRHANILVNLGGAAASDVRRLVETMKARVLERFGVALEEEVLYLGDWENFLCMS